MRHTKTLLISVLVLFVAQAGWGQTHDELSPSSVDPVKTVRLYPNPAVDYLSLKFEAPIARTVKLEMHTIIGNSLEIESEVIDDHVVRIRVKDLPTGYYLIDVKDDANQRGTYKFLKR